MQIAGYWYDRIASEGREALLFGSSAREKCLHAVRYSIAGDGLFGLFSEFPLLGEPFLDLSVYATGSAGFAEGDGFGYMPLFEYNRRQGINSFGFEFDLSKGGENHPHAVVFPPRRADMTNYVRDCLCLMGLGDRAERVLKYIAKAPWEFAYFGGFRNGTELPIRIVFRLREQDVRRIRENQQAFAQELESFGYRCGDLPGLAIMAARAKTLKISFDVMPDGSLGPSLGCEYGMMRSGNDFLPERFMKSENIVLFTQLEEAGFIDTRWRSAAQSAFAAVLTFPSGAKVIVKHAVHTVKLRWKGACMDVPKLYTEMVCADLDVKENAGIPIKSV